MIIPRPVSLPFSCQELGMEEMDEVGQQQVGLALRLLKITRREDVADDDLMVLEGIEERIDRTFFR